MIFRFTIRTVVILMGLAVCIIAVAAVLAALDARKRERAAGNDRQMAQGRTTSATEAIHEIGELGDRGLATDAQVEEAQNAIRQAAPDDRDSVFRHRVCVLQHRPDCDRLFRTGAADPDPRDAPR